MEKVRKESMVGQIKIPALGKVRRVWNEKKMEIVLRLTEEGIWIKRKQ